MNQFIKITTQLMYLPLALLIFITDAKSATHYVVGVENIEYRVSTLL
ncbi:hypothetical protein [Pseudoalteromonas sp. Z9A4]|nr:hypothetical protein [Pseudoalteromonas sp. Z9A4]